MARRPPEWIGKDDDEDVPPRVRLRVLDRFGKCCAKCKRPIRSGDRWTCDHKIALINEGPNRETNLQPLCSWCVKPKDAADVAEKSATYKTRLRHTGIKTHKGRPLPGCRDSNIKIKIYGGPVDRRTGEPLRRRT